MQKLQRIHLSDPRSLSVFMIVLAIILFGALLVQPVFAATNVFSNTGSISIPYFGNADPYPSTISVSGITDTVTDVNVTISGMSHTYVPDIDILLVGPGGQNVMLMSDAGGSRGVDNITLTLDSDALESIPAYSFFPFPSGTYLPTNYEGGSDTMLAPAPAEPFGTSLDVFDGVNPNGSWSLYVRDGTTGDNGSISGGWSLNITTSDAPTITSANAATVVSGTAFTHTFTASGNPAPTLSYVPGALPAGVTLAGNVFSGTPTVPGTYTVNVTAINGISPDAAQTFTLTVAAAPPTITSANNTTFTEGSAGSFTVTATGTAPITYGLSGAPAWVSINSSSGALSGTPPAGSAATGSFTFTITADNAALGNATQSFTLNVTGTPPAFTSTDNASVLATTSFSHTFAYTGNPAPVFSHVSGALPTGVTLVGNVLSGTPTVPGVYTISVKAANGISPDATQTFTLTVTGSAPTITSLDNASVLATTSFSHTFAYTGNPAPTFSHVSGALPTGVTLVGNVLSGTPTVPGVYTIEVTAANGISPDATQTFTLTVTGSAPTITSTDNASVLATTSFSHTFAYTGNPAPVFSHVSGALPTGVTLVGNVLSGTPSVPGVYTISVKAANGISPDATQTFTLTVTGDSPAFTSLDNASVLATTSFSHTFAYTGNPAPVFSHVSGALPAGVSLVGDILSGTPTVPGIYTIAVTAANGISPDATQTFTLTVTGDAPTITSTDNASVLATTSFSHTFAYTGNPAPVFSHVSGALPAGVSLVGDILSGTPTVPGTYTIEVTAANGISPDATQTFTLTVTGSAPTITSLDNASVLATTSFSHTFVYIGNPAPTFSHVSGTLPSGVTLVGDVLSGTPTVPGVYTISVKAANGISPDATQTFTLTVTGSAPTITSLDNASVLATTSFSHTFAYTGNPAPLLSYVSGALPTGVTLVGDVLSGTPTVPGIYTIAVTAANGVTPDATQTFTLTVTGDAPMITSAETLYVGQGDFMAHTFTAVGNPAPALSYSAINLPPGVSLTGDLLTGYPQLSGTYGVTVTATNGVAPAAVQHFVLNVGALPEAPPLPFAEDVNFLETTAVRTGVPVPLFDTILVRIMYQYGHSTQWLGSDMYSAGSVGIQGVVNLGVQQAIDLSSGNGDSYWEGGATFCLHGEGALIWMAAVNTPRHAEIIGSYTVPEFPGYTCATLFEPGTLVLVSQLPE